MSSMAMLFALNARLLSRGLWADKGDHADIELLFSSML